MKIGHILPAMLACASLANAVELHPVDVRRGTEGLDKVPLTIANAAEAAVSCNADFAHWYSARLATVEPGESARLELWFDPKTGTFTVLNDKRENLPVERLWCGLSGRAYETRAQIALGREAAASGSRAVSCRMGQDRLACR
ncbi:hypothetical protein E3C22_01385 [Jiella endophytica]|uniref:Uncharacterized protein n=1 Tax=Jiella endophytica TaxID=2558362 RepID=A0A4Y8RUE8_9HYPH|nr:hypothetical protein [Jiella endophytica]TFF27161.1 hypothetical protein E3C22_01385 [Jiella endophytica]